MAEEFNPDWKIIPYDLNKKLKEIQMPTRSCQRTQSDS